MRLACEITLIVCATGTTAALCAERPSADQGLSEVVVRAKKIPDPVSDELLTQRVEKALTSQRYLDVDHVSVHTVNGVVHLQGSVSEDWDLDRVLRLVRRTPGVRRIADDLILDSPGGS